MLAMGDSALRKEADAMTFVGCDLHTRMQQVAVLDTGTGEVSERQLAHDGSAIEEFYAALPAVQCWGSRQQTRAASWVRPCVDSDGRTGSPSPKDSRPADSDSPSREPYATGSGHVLVHQRVDHHSIFGPRAWLTTGQLPLHETHDGSPELRRRYGSPHRDHHS